MYLQFYQHDNNNRLGIFIVLSDYYVHLPFACIHIEVIVATPENK